jgi:hypothetical protein
MIIKNHKWIKIVIQINLVYILSFLYKFSGKRGINEENIRICLCTLGKGENLYAKEYVDHYKRYKVDKIFLYDNNDLDDETFDDILKEDIKSKFVEIINYRGLNKPQMIAMNDCYKKNYIIYDWIIFYDMDEFIFLRNYSSIKKFLTESKFDHCDIVQLNWVQHTDNNKLYRENGSLAERFKERGKKIEGLIDIKSMIRGKIKTQITHAHFLNLELKCCNGFGQKKKFICDYYDKNPDYDFYYIDHYYSKSTEEFIYKIKRGSVAYGNKYRDGIIQYYFKLNNITSEKIDYFEKEININLSEFRQKIK